MFTGIIQALGTIKKLDNRGNDIRLTVSSSTLDMSDVALGDSIATNGVCLTVTDMGPDYYCADVSAETIKLTGFAHYSVGSTVNLEKAMRPLDRLGGHIVSGHVDGVGQIKPFEHGVAALQIVQLAVACLDSDIATVDPLDMGDLVIREPARIVLHGPADTVILV